MISALSGSEALLNLRIRLVSLDDIGEWASGAAR